MRKQATGKSIWSEDIGGERYYLHWLDAGDVTAQLSLFGAACVPRAVCTKNVDRNWSDFLCCAMELQKESSVGDLALFLESEYETYNRRLYKDVEIALKSSQRLIFEITSEKSVVAFVEERFQWSKRSLRFSLGPICFTLPLIEEVQLHEFLSSDPVLFARAVVSDSPTNSNLYRAIWATISLLNNNNQEDQSPGVILNQILPIFKAD